mmetsp:Transcript_1586/g.3387  ORF Transcript_1586/g.3387 Transcript_1586/m.3387 type:complete len:254 (+) Transcript_1586:127-888(+)
MAMIRWRRRRRCCLFRGSSGPTDALPQPRQPIGQLQIEDQAYHQQESHSVEQGEFEPHRVQHVGTRGMVVGGYLCRRGERRRVCRNVSLPARPGSLASLDALPDGRFVRFGTVVVKADGVGAVGILPVAIRPGHRKVLAEVTLHGRPFPVQIVHALDGDAQHRIVKLHGIRSGRFLGWISVRTRRRRFGGLFQRDPRQHRSKISVGARLGVAGVRIVALGFTVVVVVDVVVVVVVVVFAIGVLGIPPQASAVL